jgi:hypothetical protein
MKIVKIECMEVYLWQQDLETQVPAMNKKLPIRTSPLTRHGALKPGTTFPKFKALRQRLLFQQGRSKLQSMPEVSTRCAKFTNPRIA